MWCQGWSEPNAGSDLASLTTRAVQSGDYYIINGQKAWTSGAHRAQWCFMMARTDPNQARHRGLSFFLVDMKSPGLKLRPVRALNGTHMFNEMFFDDVKVPKENMVGEENRGWYVSLMTMNFERSSIGFMAEAKRNLEELIEFCKETKRDGQRLSEQTMVRSLLAQLVIEVEIGLALSYKVAWLQGKGEAFVIPAAIAGCAGKVYGSELGQRLAYAGSRILGLYGQVKAASKWSPLKGRFESSYQECVSLNMGGGTSEIMRNVIAMRGLEMPR
jgi:alkylation response protein AidB-like acyl-CoA dehydrogenase